MTDFGMAAAISFHPEQAKKGLQKGVHGVGSRLAGDRDLGERTVTARRRHLDAFRRARDHFVAGREALAKQSAGEVFAEELRLAHLAIGEITGTTSSDDLLGMIFTEFCIGK